MDAHLDCYECREELAGLAGLPALLRRVPLADAERIGGGRSGRPADATRRRRPSCSPRCWPGRRPARRIRRWRELAAAAAAVVWPSRAGAAERLLGSARRAAGRARQASHTWHTARGDGRTGR